ncbi:hypothetical protein AB0K47_16870 [Streptomyces tirandamycinicus]|nr:MULTISPECIES: hypothetical protein [Streptomyces]MCY0983066.1 hypothetical protein [Streptomyces tirandamycinicus]
MTTAVCPRTVMSLPLVTRLHVDLCLPLAPHRAGAGGAPGLPALCRRPV